MLFKRKPKNFVAIILLGITFLLTHISVIAQEYINGNLITDTVLSSGVSAPSGTFWSQIQSPNTSNGTLSSTDTKRSVVDDFTVPAGQFWKISKFTCYSYCTGYFGNNLPFDSLMIIIYKADPRLPNVQPLWGDFQTNRLSTGSFGKIYRVGSVFDTSRKVWEIKGNIDTTLGEGTYWVEWILGRQPNVSSNAIPFSTIKNLANIPGSNALIHDLSTNSFIPITDQGSGFNQDMHFRLQYINVFPASCSGIPGAGKTNSEISYACPGQRFRLSVATSPLITGLTYDWQISADSISWTTITGSDKSYLDTSQITARFYRCLVSCGNNTSISQPIKVSMQSFVVTAQPNGVLAGCGEESTMKVKIQSTSPVSNFQWQWRNASNAVWNDLNSSPVIKGTNTDSLVFLKLSDSFHNRIYRLRIQNSCGSQLISNSAALQVRQFISRISPDTLQVCETSRRLTVSATQSLLDSFSSNIGGSGKLIRDTIIAGVTDTINISSIPSNARLTGISVRLHIRHSYVGDLSINLKSPNGKVINLLYYLNGTNNGPSAYGFLNTLIGSNGNKLTSEGSNPYSDFFRADLADPNANLEYPIGPSVLPANATLWPELFSQPNGSWVLGLYDGFTGDIGRLFSWTLILTYSSDTRASWSTNAIGSIFKDSATTLPLSAGETVQSIFVKPSSDAYYVAVSTHRDCQASLPDTAFAFQKSRNIPVFNQVPEICAGGTFNLPNLSLNGIRGAWSPAVNNLTTTTYSFTPTPGQCARGTSMTVVVKPIQNPIFNPIAAICAGSPLSLPNSSINGITGTWSPAINNSSTTTYTFTPGAGQCAVQTSLTVKVIPVNRIPAFNPVGPVCAGTTISLPDTSLNGLAGSWSPAIDNNLTTTYTFTPAPGQCTDSTARLTVVVTENKVPTFNAIDSICSGVIFSLPNISLNGISGNWSPAINNTATTTYTFTPNPGQCATTATMRIVVKKSGTPLFDPISPVCAGTDFTLPDTSKNGFSGSWTPAIDNSTTTTYTFTATGGACVTPASLTVVVKPKNLVPAFDPISPICRGSLFSLPDTSLNGITGSWTPSINIDSTTTYTFTPSPGQCTDSTASTTVRILEYRTPTFLPFDSVCAGTMFSLPDTSLNGISGTWTPAINNSATTTYTFAAPTDDQACYYPVDLTVIITECGGALAASPNPANGGSFRLSLPPDVANGILSIYDNKGSRMRQISTGGRSNITIDSRMLSSGVYILVLTDPSGKTWGSTRVVVP